MDAGFALLQEKDTNIIPNYFSPYIKENIDIYVSSTKRGQCSLKQMQIRIDLIKEGIKMDGKILYLSEKNLIDNNLLTMTQVMGSIEKMFELMYQQDYVMGE